MMPSVNATRPIIEYAKPVAAPSGRFARSVAIVSSIGICLLAILWAGMRMAQAADWRKCGAEARTGFSLYPEAERCRLVAFGVCAVVCGAWIVVWIVRAKYRPTSDTDRTETLPRDSAVFSACFGSRSERLGSRYNAGAPGRWGWDYCARVERGIIQVP